MADLLQWGQEWFQGMREAHVAQDVTYERPGLFSLTVPATFGRQVHVVDTGDGVAVSVESWDFKIRRSALTHLGTVYRPRTGDLISFTRNGETFVHEVNPIDGEECYRDFDRFKDSIIVHTDQRSIT